MWSPLTITYNQISNTHQFDTKSHHLPNIIEKESGGVIAVIVGDEGRSKLLLIGIRVNELIIINPMKAYLKSM